MKKIILGITIILFSSLNGMYHNPFALLDEQTLTEQLAFAIKQGHLGQVNILVTAGAKLNKPQWWLNKKLIWCLQNGLFALGLIYRRLGAVNEYELVKAAADGNLAVVQRLAPKARIWFKAPPARKNALHEAASWGHAAVVEYLLQSTSIKRNARSGHWFTAMHYAAKWGHLAVVRLLVEHGACHLLEDTESRTPRDVAQRYQHTAVVEYLDSLD